MCTLQNTHPTITRYVPHPMDVEQLAEDHTFCNRRSSKRDIASNDMFWNTCQCEKDDDLYVYSDTTLPGGHDPVSIAQSAELAL